MKIRNTFLLKQLDEKLTGKKQKTFRDLRQFAKKPCEKTFIRNYYFCVQETSVCTALKWNQDNDIILIFDRKQDSK